jgi:myosin protein heavy chain
LSAENETFRKELEALKFKYGALLTTAKTHEEMASRAAREGQLRAEEVSTDLPLTLSPQARCGSETT